MLSPMETPSVVKRLQSKSGTRLPRVNLWTNVWAAKGRASISVTISSSSLPTKAKGDSLMLSGGSIDGWYAGFCELTYTSCP